MKADIIVFSYNDHYAVNDDFDLNQVRRLVKVKEVKGKYIPDEEKYLEIRIGREVSIDEVEIEKLNFDKLKEDRDSYSRWWIQEQAKVIKLEEELKCKKLEIEELRKEVKEDD